MSLDAISRPTDALTTTAVPAELLETIAEAAPALDRGDRQVAEFLPELGRAGLLDLGVAGSDGQTANGTLLDQASVIEAIARHSLSLAFALWGQRMAIDYLATTGGSFADRHLDRLRRGETIGVSGMAPAFKASAGAGELGLELGTGESGGGAGSLALRGKLEWASNLYPDAVIVSAAYGSADSRSADPTAAAPQTGPKSIVAFSLSEAGVSVGPELDLLALKGTASTSVSVEITDYDREQIIGEDFAGLLARWRPVAAVLQSSFCLGLAASAHSGAEAGLHGINGVFTDDVEGEGRALVEAKSRLVDIIHRIGTADRPDPREVLSLRLEAGRLATATSALEIRTAGGRGYAVGSHANRRFREATFIPVQSPSESQLRWELDRLG
ncbi:MULTISPECIES: acyl-CoA dehydrogenase family protein [unclassified Brevibacterium]|uniref:acyl-CoA dehydrogenase family protein n=1 Tax=unclassified Brevibacterium TaxID=2614124 RepID=UPI001092FE9C|nr:acyl-CoA dehydrogenase family protein [Brevibacterium sp. S22]TGD31020.1 acyl-CoA dehydrogenase [Brevibacterium sp. S22]